MGINEFSDNSNQVSAQQSVVTEIIIAKKWLIQANPYIMKLKVNNVLKITQYI